MKVTLKQTALPMHGVAGRVAKAISLAEGDYVVIGDDGRVAFLTPEQYDGAYRDAGSETPATRSARTRNGKVRDEEKYQRRVANTHAWVRDKVLETIRDYGTPISTTEVAKLAGCSESTVYYATEGLRQAGLIEVQHGKPHRFVIAATKAPNGTGVPAT